VYTKLANSIGTLPQETKDSFIPRIVIYVIFRLGHLAVSRERHLKPRTTESYIYRQSFLSVRLRAIETSISRTQIESVTASSMSNAWKYRVSSYSHISCFDKRTNALQSSINHRSYQYHDKLHSSCQEHIEHRRIKESGTHQPHEELRK
jgi:hypothetical protein